MKERFSNLEVMKMAKDIEQRGRDFYLKQKEATDNPELKSLFTKLADDEQDHYDRFVELTKKIDADPKKAEYLYEEEVSAYFNYLIEYSVFPPTVGSESAKALENMDRAIRLAIQAEKDSILFYREMYDYNQGDTLEVLEKLISEEKQHLRDLSHYAEEMNNN